MELVPDRLDYLCTYWAQGSRLPSLLVIITGQLLAV
jgi:hypothetical protein